MESLNKVELVGTVGTVYRQEINGKTLVRFALLTEYAHKNEKGESVVESTWHSIRSWGDDAKIEKGDIAHVTGRIRSNRYVSADGATTTQYEIIAEEVTKPTETN